MNWVRPVSILLLFLLALPALTIPAPAQAQAPSISTSADPHGGKIWENSWLEVKITDTNARGSGKITVTVYANNTPVDAIDFVEIGASGIFVAYFKVSSGAAVAVSPVNAAPANPLATGANYTLTGPVGTTFTFEYVGPTGTVSADVALERFTGTLSLDRTDVPPFNNTVIYVTLYDQDFNKDPTAKDKINLTVDFTLVYKNDSKIGPQSYDIPVYFTETEPNSASFSGSIKLGDVFQTLNSTLASKGIVYNSTTSDITGAKYVIVNLTSLMLDGVVPLDHVEITLTKVNNSAAEVTEDPKPSAEFVIKPEEGLITTPATTSIISLESELLITVTDPDANIDTASVDSLNVKVTLEVQGSTIGSIEVKLEETGENTGVFAEEVPLTYASSASVDDTNDILYINFSSADEPAEITVVYKDPTVDDITSEVTVPVTSYEPSISAEPASVFPLGEVTITLVDKDLNDKGDDVADSFGKVVPKGNDIIVDFGNGGKLRVVIEYPNGTKVTAKAASDFFVFFEEVEPGEFEATFEVPWIAQTLEDGSKIIFEWLDSYTYADPEANVASAAVTVVKPEISVSLDKSEYPLPNDGKFTIHVTITNVYENEKPGIVETLADSVTINLTLWNGTTVNLATISGSNMKETGANTGVFEGSADIDLVSKLGKAYLATGATLEAVYVYQGNEYKATAKIIPHTAEVSVNDTVVSIGDHIEIVLNEPDLDKDSAVAESYNVTVTIGGVDYNAKLTETDKSTGVFKGVFRIGADAPFDKVEPATEFEISYSDEFTEQTSVTTKRSATTSVTVEVIAHDAKIWVGTAEKESPEVAPYGTFKIYYYDPDLILDWEKGKHTFTGDSKVYIRSELLDELYVTDFESVEDKPGLFVAEVEVKYSDTPNTADSILQVTAPDRTVIRAIDYVTSDGTKNKALIYWITVKSWDAEIWVEPKKAFYNDGEDIVIYVKDPDQNKDPDARDTIEIRITSWRNVGGVLQPVDPAGLKLSLVETEENSGVFKVPYTIDSKNPPPFFSVGDILKIEYKDPLNAEGEEETFSITLQIGYTTPTPVVPPAPVEVSFVDTEGKPTVPAAGKPMLLQVPVENSDTIRSVTVDIVLIAYTPEGVPVSVSYGRITLAPGESAVASIGWIPPSSGTFNVKVFFWDLANKLPLSEEPLELTVTVE